jgi:hypothetical protein
MGLKTPCDNDVFFTLPHGDTLQTPFDASFPPPALPLEMDTVSIMEIQRNPLVLTSCFLLDRTGSR